MGPVEVPTVQVYAGDTLTFPTYTFTTEGETLDLSAHDLTAQWRPSRTSETVIPLTVDTSNAASGRVTLSASPDDTRAMRGGGVWDLQSVHEGAVRTLIVGSTEWTRDVTRD